MRLPKPIRRCLQFSLATMFVFVTLLCAALAIWVVPAERQRRAVAAIEALGGFVDYVDNQATSESFPVAFLRERLPRAYLDEVEYVRLDNSQVTDAGLAHLEGLTGLQSLSLDNTQITDAGLARLQELTGLQTLWLDNTPITDAGLAHLEGLTGLQSLWLDNTQITDAGLAQLKRLTGLQWLYLNNTQVTDAGLAQLGEALPNCNIPPSPPQ
ncbi:MAG TPA: leucine-rich repeat domain-containing protein [Pirellulales bacterium]|nr:leucine-rich repeat domain-containing protein [Pirellulales bacterium]